MEALVDRNASIDQRYFNKFVLNLFFHASMFHLLIFKQKSREQIQQGSSYLTNIIHRCLQYSIDYDDPLYAIFCGDLFQLLQPEKSLSGLSELGFLDQANFILYLEYICDLQARFGNPLKNNTNFAKDLFENITLKNDDFNLHFKILKFYLEKDYQGMLNLFDAEKDTFGDNWKIGL